MSSPRPVLLAAALLLAAAPASCNKNKQKGTDAPLVIDGGGGTPPGGEAPDGVATRPDAVVEKIEITASISGLADVFDMLKDLSTRWNPDSSGDAKAEIQAGLLQMGFAPSFLDNIDLGGAHGVWFAYPQQDDKASAEDVDLAATVAVIDGRKVIEGAPASSRPQPLGDGMWEIKAADNQRFLIKESGKELLVGMSPEDVARAAKLRGELKTDKRLYAKVINIPADELNPAAILGVPESTPIIKQLSAVVKELGAIELVGDVGTARDAVLTVSAEAPFSKLGLEPIGAPRASATAVEGKLPGKPMFVSTLSWGDPTLLEKSIHAAVPMGMIPEPFAPIVKQAVDSTVVLLKQIANDVVVALYVDGKGQLSVLIAADVKDEGKAREAMRKISDAIKQGVEAQQTLQGANKDAQIGFEWKPDGAAISGGKADKLILRAPKTMKGELDDVKWLLTKDALETISFVKSGTAVVAMGAGAKGLAGDVMKGIAKPRKDSLAQHDGLGRVRASMGGCQICASIDVVSYLRFRLNLLAANDKAAAKDAKVRLAALKKAGDVGDPALGVKVEAKKGALGIVLPKETLFADKAAIDAVKKANELVDGGGVAAPPPVPPTEKPSGKPPAGMRKGPAKKDK
jgi:hypothetical protein